MEYLPETCRLAQPRSCLPTTRSFDRDPPAPHGTTRPSAHNFCITHLLGSSAQRHPILIPIRRGVRVAGAEEAFKLHRTQPVTVGMGTGAGAGADMLLRPPESDAGGGCGRENPLQHVERVARGAGSIRCGSPFLCDFSYSTPPSLLTPRCIFSVPPTSPLRPLPQRLIGCTTSTSSPLCFPSPVSRVLDAWSVIPVAPIPAARISIDLPSRSPPRAVPRQEAPLHLRQPQQHPFRGAQHRARAEKERVGNRSPWPWMARPHLPLLWDRPASRAEVVVGVGGPPRPAHVTSQTGARGWVRRSAESVPYIDNCGAVFGGRGGGSVEEEEGWRQEQERRTWKRAHLHLPRPHPLPLPLPSFFPPSRRPLPDMPIGFFASGPSAPCARRPGPRTTLADAESTARMQRRMEKREEEREREEKRESGTCEEREEGARWWMEKGMRKAHMMCVTLLLLAPHASPARRGKGIGGEEDVNELKHQCNFPDLPLRLLILPSGRGSAPSSRRLLIGVDDGDPQSPPAVAKTRMARVHPAPLRLDLASTSPPDSTGFISTSVSSTNSALTDYEVEVVEIRVQKGEFDGIIP
ncbi:hypothetical protein B0H14DRAFT_3871481 [Mycena olivaceomarginata]|nr:hypothetical protein B0H14DRAFT_3871481 [Mycena olivaceomarginata]